MVLITGVDETLGRLLAKALDHDHRVAGLGLGVQWAAFKASTPNRCCGGDPATGTAESINVGSA